MTIETPIPNPFEIERVLLQARRERAAAMRAGYVRFGKKLRHAFAGLYRDRGRIALDSLRLPRA